MTDHPPGTPPDAVRELVARAAWQASMAFWRRAFEVGMRHWDETRRVLPTVSDEPQHVGELVSALLARQRSAAMDVALGVPAGLDEFAGGLGATRPVPQTGAVRVADRTLTFPVAVRDASQGLATFVVDLDRAQAVLGETSRSMRLVEVDRGQALATLMAVDYRDSDLDRYLELAIALHVTPAAHAGPVGLWFCDMLVNADFTREAGRAVWGYPKTHADLDMRATDRTAAFELYGANRHRACRVEFPRGGRAATTAVPVSTYAELDGRLAHTVITRTGRRELVLPGEPIAIVVDDPSHPFCQRLQALALPERAMLCTWSDEMTAELAAPAVYPG